MSIGLPFLLAMARLQKIDKSYIPFIVYLGVGFVIEICSYISIEVLKTHNAVIQNLFVLLEWSIITWQFKCWGVFGKGAKWFLILIGSGIIVWTLENIIADGLFSFGPYFRWLYSFAIVIISINTINYIITHDFRKLYRNATFIICLCFVTFFSYKIIYEWAYQIFAINQNIALSNIIISFFGYLNAFINVMYVVAILAMFLRSKPVATDPEYATDR